jgi:MFS family permease
MSYTTIVAYASAVTPPGTSATMQGLAAGMDDGFGYAIGSLIGGLLYHEVGGRVALIIFCAISFVCCVMHFVLYKCSLKHTNLPKGCSNEPEYKPPLDAIEAVQVATSSEIDKNS